MRCHIYLPLPRFTPPTEGQVAWHDSVFIRPGAEAVKQTLPKQWRQLVCVWTLEAQNLRNLSTKADMKKTTRMCLFDKWSWTFWEGWKRNTSNKRMSDPQEVQNCEAQNSKSLLKHPYVTFVWKKWNIYCPKAVFRSFLEVQEFGSFPAMLPLTDSRGSIKAQSLYILSQLIFCIFYSLRAASMSICLRWTSLWTPRVHLWSSTLG